MSAARYLFKAPSLRGVPVLQEGSGCQGRIRLPGRDPAAGEGSSCQEERWPTATLAGAFLPAQGWAMPPCPGREHSPLCSHLCPCLAPAIERDWGTRFPTLLLSP